MLATAPRDNSIAHAMAVSPHELQGSGSLSFDDCFEEQGVSNMKKCKSLFFNECYQFTMPAGSSCTATTQSDSQLKWFSWSFEVMYWELVKDDDGHCNQLASPSPNTYQNEASMLRRNGVCGFKFQIDNRSSNGEYDFEILKNGAAYAATLGMAAAGLATLAMF